MGPAVGASEPAVAGPSPGHGKSEPAQADGERDSAGQSEVTRTVAARMAELRKQRQWSATALAAEMTNAGVSWDRYIVSNLERGRRANMTVDELLALAEVLGVSHTALLPDALGGEDDPLPGTSRAIDVLARFNEGFAASIHSQSRLDWLEMLVPALELAFSTLKIELLGAMAGCYEDPRIYDRFAESDLARQITTVLEASAHVVSLRRPATDAEG